MMEQLEQRMPGSYIPMWKKTCLTPKNSLLELFCGQERKFIFQPLDSCLKTVSYRALLNSITYIHEIHLCTHYITFLLMTSMPSDLCGIGHYEK